jgi:hypothetical protein
MSLFVVRHQHEAERCPARDPQMGAILLRHIAPENARSFGLNIHGEAVVDGAHTLYLILDAPAQENVARFMQPFAQAGSVDIMPASPCEVVVQRQGCEPAPAAAGEQAS